MSTSISDAGAHSTINTSTRIPASKAGTKGYATAGQIINLYREKLTADRTYYVRTDGSDSNDGLTNTSGGAWATLTKAWKYICLNLDLQSFTVVIQIADGTYDGMTTLGDVAGVDSSFGHFYEPVGGGVIIFRGNTGDRSAVTLVGVANSNYYCFEFANRSGAINIEYITMDGTNSDPVAMYRPGSYLIQYCRFINCSGRWCVYAGETGTIVTVYDVELAGSCAVFFGVFSNAEAALYRKIALSGSGSISTAFVLMKMNASLQVYLNAGVTGTMTGKRYELTLNSSMELNGYTLPGDSAGTTASGAQAV